MLGAMDGSSVAYDKGVKGVFPSRFEEYIWATDGSSVVEIDYSV